jgi:hypothetical protein
MKMNVSRQFIELIQVAICKKEVLTVSPSEQDWSAMFDVAERREVAGIVFIALDRLAAINCEINEIHEKGIELC